MSIAEVLALNTAAGDPAVTALPLSLYPSAVSMCVHVHGRRVSACSCRYFFVYPSAVYVQTW